MLREPKVVAGPTGKCLPSDATVRALKRVEAGERPTLAAQAEGIHASTLFRQLAKKKPYRRFLTIEKTKDGFDTWLEDQRDRQISADVSFATITELQAALPSLLAKV